MYDIPLPLLTDIDEGRCLPFIGAGFSLNASLPSKLRMPDWGALTSILRQGANADADATPLAVAQQYEYRFGRVQLIESIRRALYPDNARPGKAHLAFVSLPFDTLYTTNFDLLLEDAYATMGRPYRSLVGESQLPFHAGQMASSIVKMHGDLRHEEHIIITQRDYDGFLDRYPVIATHLSAMLITRTPLFLGYSLSDPDFCSIRKVVRSRLGQFERMAYMIQFDQSKAEIEKALEDRIHIISIPTSANKSRDELLNEFFQQMLENIDTKATATFRNARPDVFEPIEPEVAEKTANSPGYSAVVETTSSLCFVMMPFGEAFDQVYRTLIYPAATESGLMVIRADEMAAPGFIMEQIRVAIQQSRICIADVSDKNPNVMFEIGFAQANGKPIIFLAKDLTDLPFDIAALRVIKYGTEPSQVQDSLKSAIQQVLSEDRFAEAERLLGAGAFRASIAITSVVLEHLLIGLLDKHGLERRPRMSIGQMIKLLRQHNLLDVRMTASLLDSTNIRNRAVHNLAEPSAEDAHFIFSATKRFANSIQ